MKVQQTEKKENLVKYKLLYTAIILLVYSIGKGLPLYGIDVSEYLYKVVDAEDLIPHRCQRPGNPGEALQARRAGDHHPE